MLIGESFYKGAVGLLLPDCHLHSENNSPQSGFYIDCSQPMIAPVNLKIFLSSCFNIKGYFKQQQHGSI